MAYIPPNPNGQNTMVNSSPVVIALNQSNVPVTVSNPTTNPETGLAKDLTITNNLGTQADVVATTDTGAFSLLALFKRLLGKFPTLISGKTPVIIDKADSSILVSGQNPVGVAPALNPISISGVDGGGLKRNLLTDINGKIETTLAQPLTDTQLRATALPISGTVSTGLSQGITDTQIRATPLPISGTVSTGLLQGVTDTQLRAIALPISGTITAITNALPAGTNTIGNINELRASTLAVTITAASGVAATLTLPAAGVGLFHYITSLDIVLYSAAARTGNATPNTVTTTNLPGAIAFTFSTAGAIGTSDVRDFIRVTPLRSAVANTATTVVAPIATGGIWRIRATYFTGV